LIAERPGRTQDAAAYGSLHAPVRRLPSRRAGWRNAAASCISEASHVRAVRAVRGDSPLG